MLIDPVNLPSSWAMAAVLLPILGFAVCVAMAIFRKDSGEWKVTALFCTTPLIFVLIAALIMPCY